MVISPNYDIILLVEAKNHILEHFKKIFRIKNRKTTKKPNFKTPLTITSKKAKINK